MITQTCISLDDRSNWQAALKGIPHTFFHTWENCRALYLTNKLNTYLYCFETDDTRVVCPISERKFEEHTDIFTPYGFSGFVGHCSRGSFADHWLQFVKKRGFVCGYIGLNPVFENCAHFAGRYPIHYNNIYLLNLTLSEAALFNNLSTNRKRQIKKWEKQQHGYILDKQLLISFFLAHYHDFLSHKNAAGVYNFSVETLSFLVNMDQVFMVGAGSKGKVEAVSVFAYTPAVGDFLFNISLPEGQQHSVPLLWYAVKQLRSLRIPLMNLGGGVHEHDSLAAFKERFGAKKLPLRCLKQIYDPLTYEKLCLRVNTDPNDLSGYFPAYRKVIANR